MDKISPNEAKPLKRIAPKSSEKDATSGNKPARSKPKAQDYTLPDAFLFPGEGKEWSPDDPDKPLTHRQWLFVTEYTLDFNIRMAMSRAGYPNNTHGTRMMRAPNIRKHISRVLDERYRANILTANKLLSAIVLIVDASLGDYLDWKGTDIKLKPIEDIPPNKLTLLAELKQGERGGWSIKLHDKLSAIEKGMRHLGMYDRNRQATNRPGEITRTTLRAVKAGTLSVDDAIMDLDMEGIPIPRSLELMASRQKVEDDGPKDDGGYSPVSPEEMAAKAENRRREIERQRTQFVPERRAEVQEIKDELGQGSFAHGGE